MGLAASATGIHCLRFISFALNGVGYLSPACAEAVAAWVNSRWGRHPTPRQKAIERTEPEAELNAPHRNEPLCPSIADPKVSPCSGVAK